MIKVTEIWAVNEDVLQEKLNKIPGRIIKIGDIDSDDCYQVIYEEYQHLSGN